MPSPALPRALTAPSLVVTFRVVYLRIAPKTPAADAAYRDVFHSFPLISRCNNLALAQRHW